MSADAERRDAGRSSERRGRADADRRPEHPIAALVVRAARPDELDAVRRIAGAAWRATYRDYLGEAAIERFLDRAYAEWALRRHAAEGGLLVAVPGPGSGSEEPLGFARVAVRDEVGRLGALYLTPGQERRGYGSALLRAVAAWCEERGATELRLSVADRNHRARAFYRRHGFEERPARRTSFLGEELVERECVRRLRRADP